MRVHRSIRRRKVKLLDQVRLTERQRLAAQQCMARAESIADFLLSAIAAVRSVMHGIGRGARRPSRNAN